MALITSNSIGNGNTTDISPLPADRVGTTSRFSSLDPADREALYKEMGRSSGNAAQREAQRERIIDSLKPDSKQALSWFDRQGALNDQSRQERLPDAVHPDAKGWYAQQRELNNETRVERLQDSASPSSRVTEITSPAPEQSRRLEMTIPVRPADRGKALDSLTIDQDAALANFDQNIPPTNQRLEMKIPVRAAAAPDVETITATEVTAAPVTTATREARVARLILDGDLSPEMKVHALQSLQQEFGLSGQQFRDLMKRSLQPYSAEKFATSLNGGQLENFLKTQELMDDKFGWGGMLWENNKLQEVARERLIDVQVRAQLQNAITNPFVSREELVRLKGDLEALGFSDDRIRKLIGQIAKDSQASFAAEVKELSNNELIRFREQQKMVAGVFGVGGRLMENNAFESAINRELKDRARRN